MAWCGGGGSGSGVRKRVVRASSSARFNDWLPRLPRPAPLNMIFLFCALSILGPCSPDNCDQFLTSTQARYTPTISNFPGADEVDLGLEVFGPLQRRVWRAYVPSAVVHNPPDPSTLYNYVIHFSCIRYWNRGIWLTVEDDIKTGGL